MPLRKLLILIFIGNSIVLSLYISFYRRSAIFCVESFFFFLNSIKSTLALTNSLKVFAKISDEIWQSKSVEWRPVLWFWIFGLSTFDNDMKLYFHTKIEVKYHSDLCYFHTNGVEITYWGVEITPLYLKGLVILSF